MQRERVEGGWRVRAFGLSKNDAKDGASESRYLSVT